MVLECFIFVSIYIIFQKKMLFYHINLFYFVHFPISEDPYLYVGNNWTFRISIIIKQKMLNIVNKNVL